ncbi:MAG: hypothetical protein O6834_01370, partial [Actinobacteria bacterium]|nr:hypothetical protein [Actinomycetota bacterium]
PASLKTLGDREGLPAVIHLSEGRLSIQAGNESIGEWGLDEIQLEPTPTGYRMAAEGEQIILEFTDKDAFQAELSSKCKREWSLPDTGKLLSPVDKGIAFAEKRWGALLPEWAFTRVMFGVVIGALALTIIFPGLVSAFLLIAGLLMVMLGAVVFTDPMLASKWLPGAMAPVHVLIFGVVILILGVLLGVIAS